MIPLRQDRRWRGSFVSFLFPHVPLSTFDNFYSVLILTECGIEHFTLETKPRLWKD